MTLIAPTLVLRAALALLCALAGVAGSGAEEAAAPYVVVLGVAQDGGVPQVGDKELERWDDPSRHRLVASLALVDPRTGRRWLFDATPDLPEQLVELDRIAPHPETPGLDGVFLTHAHVGHYAGLLFLGHEVIGANRVPVYAMPRMREYLSSDGPWDQLVRYENVELRELSDGLPVSLAEDLSVTPLRVPHREEYSEVVGFRIDGPERSLLFIPDIDSYDDWARTGTRVEDVLREVDVAYLDGTFWADGEIEGRDMSAFPHPRISESVERFSRIPEEERPDIRFIHLNHTNPVLDPGGPERATIEAAGMAVAEEGERSPLG